MAEETKKFKISKNLKKGFKILVQFAVSWVASFGLVKYGIDFDQDKLTVSILVGIECLGNFLKIKYPKAFGWL